MARHSRDTTEKWVRFEQSKLGWGRRLRDPQGRPLVLCKRSPSSSRGTILMAAKLGKDALWGWWGQDLYSSSVSWPLAEVLSTRKGTRGYRSGSNCTEAHLGHGWTGQLKGPGPDSMLHLEKTVPFSLWPSLASGVQLPGILSVQPPAQSHPLLRRQGAKPVSTPCSLHSFLLTQGRSISEIQPRSLVCPALPPSLASDQE